MRSPPIKTVSVSELCRLLQQPTPPLLLDVREPDEWQFCRIAGAVHLPMSQLAQRLGELDPTRPTVVCCHHGVRSRRVAEILLANGFTNVANLSGGIDAWAVQIDPRVPRY
jgi:rhodanese-related sulfurtransferase